MLLGVILLLAGGTKALVVLDPGSPHASESQMTVKWVANANEDPAIFNIEIYSPTFNSVDVLGKNVPSSANQFDVTFPPLPPSDDYIFWFVNPANASDVYGNSVSFSVVAAAPKPTPQASPTKTAPSSTTAALLNSAAAGSTPPPSTPLPGNPSLVPTLVTTALITSTLITYATAGNRTSSPFGVSNAPLSTASTTPTSPLSSSSDTLQSPPLSLSPSVQLSSGPSGEIIQPQATLAAAVPSSKKTVSAGVIAGPVVGVVILLVLFGLAVIRLRSARRREDPDLQPHGYPATLRDEESGVRDRATHEKADPTPSASADREASRQAALAAQLRAVQEQLAALDDSEDNGGEDMTHRNDALRAHMQTLERQMQVQHQAPPGYLD
ncbi:hypothetical protein B0H16DRAFT_1785992 [Mycena metata]|uniref:Uncharacterized protein n=1 Tax=Mycena metata TaxID=1033252 RepID=A0AAD7HN45_9AGAR|nr:hypothetical protein B0H16DRAFT_1785992 [Mycena metata]